MIDVLAGYIAGGEPDDLTRERASRGQRPTRPLRYSPGSPLVESHIIDGASLLAALATLARDANGRTAMDESNTAVRRPAPSLAFGRVRAQTHV